MNIHFVALRRRNNFLQRLLDAANSVTYRLGADDRVFVYSNLCLDSRDLTVLRSDLNCEVYVQPLSVDESVALNALPDLVVGNARMYPLDANMLIDNDGICKRGRVTIIPAYSSSFKG